MSELLLIGPGAIGAPLAAWLADAGHRVTVLARGPNGGRIREHGIAWATREPKDRGTSRVEVVDTLAATANPDAVLFAMKSSSLEAAADAVLERFGKDVLVIGLQNGLEAHRVLPSRFPRTCFGIVHWNSFIERDGTFVCQKRGPLLVTRGPWTRDEDLALAHAFFARALPTVRSPFGRDAALCKMVINLAGSLTALIGFPDQPADDRDAFQRLLSTLLAEGVSVLRTEGVHEVRVRGTPPWRLLEASAVLPRFLTRPVFEKNLGKMHKSSLAQDLERGATETELEPIHGALLALADRNGMAVPVMRTVYALCKTRMIPGAFTPMHVSEVDRAIPR